MATILYKGMELEEVTEPKIFDPPKKCVVQTANDEPVEELVVAIFAKSSGHAFPVISKGFRAYERCALLPEKPAPRRATNRELAKWLSQGNGEVIDSTHYINTYHEYFRCLDNNEVFKTIQVRKWDDTEWHEPTVDYIGIEDAK